VTHCSQSSTPSSWQFLPEFYTGLSAGFFTAGALYFTFSRFVFREAFATLLQNHHVKLTRFLVVNWWEVR